MLSWIPDRDWWAKRVVTFAVDGASNLGVCGASARQVVHVFVIESNVFALIGRRLVLMTPLGEPCHVLQRKLGLALEAAGPTHVDYTAAVIGKEPCTMGHGCGRSCKSVSKSMCKINVVACNSSPQVIALGGHRQMHGATLLLWPMSPG